MTSELSSVGDSKRKQVGQVERVSQVRQIKKYVTSELTSVDDSTRKIV
jgi:hypothetical protein